VASDPGLRFRTADGFADLAGELALAARLAYLPAAVSGCFHQAPRVVGLERLASAPEASGGRQLSFIRQDAARCDAVCGSRRLVEPGRRNRTVYRCP